MNTVRSQPSPRHIDKLRAEHQAQAKLASESGLVPKAFLGDPTFQELVSVKSKPLTWVKNDEPANSPG